MLHENKHREKAEELASSFSSFNNAVSVTLHFNESLQGKNFNTDLRLQKANKRLFRNLEKLIFKRQRDRLKRVVITEKKLTSRNHLHALIQIPEDETYQSFVAKLWLASSKTNETLANTLYTEWIYSKKQLVSYVTKESRFDINNIDVLISRY